jgi:hypothetical protein
MQNRGDEQRWLTIRAVALLIAINGLLLAIADHPTFGLRYLIASLMLWVSAYPTWRYFSSRAREIPFLPAMTVVYFIHYGLPAFNRTLKVRSYHLEGDPVDAALALACAGEVLMLLAFYLVKMERPLPRLRLELDLQARATRLLMMAWAFGILRWALLRIQVPLITASLAAFVNFLPVVLLGGLFLLYLRRELPTLLTVLGSLLLAVILLLDFSTGAVAEPVLTVATLLFIYVSQRHRIPVGALVIMAVILIPSLGTKLEYRKVLKRQPELGTIDRISVFGELIGGVLTGAGKTSFRDAGTVAEQRVDHLSAFAFVIAKTPDPVPFWDGATYANFLWSFVPRFIYPDKPQKTLGQEYGHRYSFIDSRNYTTSINLEQTVEMYANFGALGVIIGMFLIGLLYRALYVILNHDEAGAGGVLIAASTFRVLLNIESDFSLVFGGIAQSSLLLYLLLRVIAGRKRLSTAALPSGKAAEAWD